MSPGFQVTAGFESARAIHQSVNRNPALRPGSPASARKLASAGDVCRCRVVVRAESRSRSRRRPQCEQRAERKVAKATAAPG
jgi:hypothetical protein